MKILTIIPARGGSQGVKDKNIIDVCGKPLIAYSIEQANMLKEAGLVDTVIVSTDSKKIANVSKDYGAEVPFLRPDELSSNTAKSIDFYLHALDFYASQNIYFDAVLLLQPTSPQRNFNILKDSINIFTSGKADSLLSVYREEYINDLVMYRGDEKSKCLTPVNINHNKGVRRQNHGSIFVRNGSIYLTNTSYILDKKMIICDNPLFVEMKKSDSINIDTYEDLTLLRKVLCV